MYYYEHYSDHVEAQNARNEKTRHTERNRTVEDLLKNNKTCPEESIYQIGTMGESVPPDTLFSIVNEFYEEFERRFMMKSITNTTAVISKLWRKKPKKWQGNMTASLLIMKCPTAEYRRDIRSS